MPSRRAIAALTTCLFSGDQPLLNPSAVLSTWSITTAAASQAFVFERYLDCLIKPQMDSLNRVVNVQAGLVCMCVHLHMHASSLLFRHIPSGDGVFLGLVTGDGR